MRSIALRSTSTCSDIVATVSGFALNLMTGTTGLPMTLPCPVVKKWTTEPAAAHSVTISAAADDESIKLRPGLRGSSAGLRKSMILQRPAF